MAKSADPRFVSGAEPSKTHCQASPQLDKPQAIFQINQSEWGIGALWFHRWADNRSSQTYISRGFDTNCGQARPCSSRIAAEGNMYPKVYLDLYNVCFNNPGKIYFTTSTSPNWDEQKTVSYFPNSQGPYQAHIFMNQNPFWKDIITGLRIDPAVNCSSGDDPTYYGEITVER